VLAHNNQLVNKQSIAKAKKKLASEILLSSFSATNNPLDLTKLQQIIAYFTYLNIEGEISDRTLEALVNYACSIFLQRQTEARIQQLLSEKLNANLLDALWLDND
jgi:hypothetical protein